MNTKTYKKWNWEFDYGVEEIRGNEPLPKRHAVAYYDQRGHVYRVDLREQAPGDHGDRNAFMTMARYDYFCSEDGMILQKRSLDEGGELCVLVDMSYIGEEVKEVAWWPESNVSKSVTRRRHST